MADQQPAVTEELAALRTLGERLEATRQTLATQNALDEALVTQRRVLTLRLGIPLLILAVAIAGLVAYTISNRRVLNRVDRVGQDAAVAAEFVRNCVQHPERLTPTERVEQCGQTGEGASAAIKVLINFSRCAFAVPEAQRSVEHFNNCEQEAAKAARGE